MKYSLPSSQCRRLKKPLVKTNMSLACQSSCGDSQNGGWVFFDTRCLQSGLDGRHRLADVSAADRIGLDDFARLLRQELRQGVVLALDRLADPRILLARPKLLPFLVGIAVRVVEEVGEGRGAVRHGRSGDVLLGQPQGIVELAIRLVESLCAKRREAAAQLLLDRRPSFLRALRRKAVVADPPIVIDEDAGPAGRLMFLALIRQ